MKMLVPSYQANLTKHTEKIYGIGEWVIDFSILQMKCEVCLVQRPFLPKVYVIHTYIFE